MTYAWLTHIYIYIYVFIINVRTKYGKLMVMEKLIEAQKLGIVKTVVATAGKAGHMSDLLVTLASFVAGETKGR